MEGNFNDVLQALLSAVEQNPEKKLEDLLTEQVKQFGITDEEGELKELMILCDKMVEERIRLNEIRSNGGTLQDYLVEKCKKLTEGRTEKETKNFAEAVISSAITNDNE